MKTLLLTTLLALSLVLEASARDTTDMLGCKVDGATPKS